MKPTMDDVAKAARVSRATVSRVLRGDVSVTAAKQRRVREAIERLGYEPLKRSKGQLQFGVSLPAALRENAFCLGMSEAVHAEARRVGCSVTSVGDETDLSSSDGVICVGHVPETRIVKPAVTVGSSRHAPGMSTVVADERRAYARLVGVLKENENSRIAFLGSAGRDLVLEERLRAFKLAAYAAKHPPSQLAFAECRDMDEDAEAVVRELLLSFRPSAVIAPSDELAGVASRVAAQLKLEIPEDLIVVGCRPVFGPCAETLEDETDACYVAIPLSSLASWAVRVLLGMAEDDTPAPVRAMVSCGIHWGSLRKPLDDQV